MSRMEFSEGGEYLCPLPVVQKLNVGYNKKNRSVN